MTNKMRILLLAVAIAGVGGYFMHARGLRAKPQDQAKAEQRIPVSLITAQPSSYPVLLKGLGTVIPFNNVIVRSRVDGEIVKIAFKEGQTVQQGDLLAQIDSRPYQATLDQAIAKKAQDEATLKNAKLDLDRYATLERFSVDVNRNSKGVPRAGQIRFELLGQQRRGRAMAKGYSKDLRARAVELFEDGESRREAARVLGLGASTAIRWIERWSTTGSVAALPGTGHSRSPLEAHRQWLLDLVAAEPDLTLEEIRARLKSEKRLKTGTTSVWRFYERHDITFKKNSARRRTGSA